MELSRLMADTETVCALCTPSGKGAVALIRVSGPKAFQIVSDAWEGKPLDGDNVRKVVYGKYKSTRDEIIDECLAIYFKSPASYTGEDTMELYLHGSPWIAREVLQDLILRGAKAAGPGEFTRRAFLNGKLDLVQAEGVADLIASESKAAHKVAFSQMKGEYSKELELLRTKLIEFTSLLELELDFSEEDVEFADRRHLLNLAEAILKKIKTLISSYSIGKVLKEGVPVVIAGIPNAGKSSLLNLLCGEEKAIVTDIPGTTRDIIEDKVDIKGIIFRFIDTAGLHETDDVIENIGILKAKENLNKAKIVIWVIDQTADQDAQQKELNKYLSVSSGANIIILRNKIDLIRKENLGETVVSEELGLIDFSTKTGEGLEELKDRLIELTIDENGDNEIIITNARHYEALKRSAESLARSIEGIKSGISADFIAQDIRETLHHLGTITGTITTDDLLQNIFSNFCIGK